MKIQNSFFIEYNGEIHVNTKKDLHQDCDQLLLPVPDIRVFARQQIHEPHD